MVDITFEFDAFNFDGICRTVQLTLCPIIGRDEGIVPVCYSRNVELADNLIFQPGKIPATCRFPPEKDSTRTNL